VLFTVHTERSRTAMFVAMLLICPLFSYITGQQHQPDLQLLWCGVRTHRFGPSVLFPLESGSMDPHIRLWPLYRC